MINNERDEGSYQKNDSRCVDDLHCPSNPAALKTFPFIGKKRRTFRLHPENHSKQKRQTKKQNRICGKRKCVISCLGSCGYLFSLSRVFLLFATARRKKKFEPETKVKREINDSRRASEERRRDQFVVCMLSDIS